jgi:lipoyl-dependent peroxiredoxin subunit C
MANQNITIGSRFPEFNKKSVVSVEPGKEFKYVSNRDMEGKWAVVFWWPLDFTAVCPTEIIEFNKNYSNFTDRDTLVFGASTDSEHVHLAWRKENKDLRDLKFPMIADTSKSLGETLGILTADDRIAYRATYIIDQEGIVRWLCINDIAVGRNIAEVLRVLDALQTGEFCPCNWTKGQETLS